MDEEYTISEEEILSGEKYSKLLSESAGRSKLSGMFKDWFLDYSSYVILYRAVPHIVDGLKPVQRRVLHAMYRKDDGRYTKVANLVGEAMQFHPHGDASILGALVTLGQKDLLVDCQGNWGNIITGDGNAAGRYIEARLSKFALDVVFNPKITNWMTSYDGRNQEPTDLPVKFPLLLAQGAEGIAVGLQSKILPHNFNELLDASVAILKGEEYEIYPDFPTGGIIDCSRYNRGGRGGVVKVRAKIDKIDKSTIAITEIPYGKTTHMIIDSILKAKEKGKIKIKKIDDLTASEANIVIHLPNDVSPDKTIDALYAFTDCETNIQPNACVIVEGKPRFYTVNDILEYSTGHTRDLLRQELELKLAELENAWHYGSLEKIFFENKVYLILQEDTRTWEDQLKLILAKMLEFQDLVKKPIVMEDVLKLVEKPVRKISKFDAKALDTKLKGYESEMKKVRHDIEHITEYTISHFERLKATYGAAHPRKTVVTNLENIAAAKVVSNNAKLFANFETGFVGTALKKDEGTYICDCSDLSEIIVFHEDGSYLITKVSEKAFLGGNIIHLAVFDRNDKRTTYNVIYRQGKTSIYYAKRFAVTGVTRDKEYNLTTGEDGSKVMYFSANSNGEAETVHINLRAKPKLKKTAFDFDFSNLAIKGRASRGNLVTKFSIQRILLKKKGISTIGGKEIWFDTDILKLNEDGRGMALGEFVGDDKILVVYSNGTYCTCTYDLVNKFNEGIILIQKFDPATTYSALYYDGDAKSFYVKRFSFEQTADTVSFISSGKGSYFVALSEDAYPTMIITFGKKNAGKAPVTENVAEFIGKKSVAAKGKKVSLLDVESVVFGEPLEVEEDIVEEGVEDVAEDVVEDVAEESSEHSVEPESQDTYQVGDVIEIKFDENGEPTLF